MLNTLYEIYFIQFEFAKNAQEIRKVCKLFLILNAESLIIANFLCHLRVSICIGFLLNSNIMFR